MKTENKNIKLLVIFAGLILVSLTLRYIGDDKEGLDYNKLQFTVNPEAVITDVTVESPTSKISLSYFDQAWQLNGKFEIDEAVQNVFFSVLSSFEIQRPVSNQQSDSLAQLIKSKGNYIVVKNNGEVIRSYFLMGDADNQVTYAMAKESNRPFILHIPGYNDYIAGIFELDEVNWKNKFIFNVNWTTLSSITLQYTDDEMLNIKYKDGFFEVENVSADSTAIINYLESVAFLQADHFIKEQNYDSIDSNYCTISIKESTGRNSEITFFENPENADQLIGKMKGEYVPVFTKKRILNIFKKKTDFLNDL